MNSSSLTPIGYNKPVVYRSSTNKNGLMKRCKTNYLRHTYFFIGFRSLQGPYRRGEEGGEGGVGLQNRSGDVGGVSDNPIVVIPMLGIGELGGVRSRLGLRLLEAALDVMKWDA